MPELKQKFIRSVHLFNHILTVELRAQVKKLEAQLAEQDRKVQEHVSKKVDDVVQHVDELNRLRNENALLRDALTRMEQDQGRYADQLSADQRMAMMQQEMMVQLQRFICPG